MLAGLGIGGVPLFFSATLQLALKEVVDAAPGVALSKAVHCMSAACCTSLYFVTVCVSLSATNRRYKLAI